MKKHIKVLALAAAAALAAPAGATEKQAALAQLQSTGIGANPARLVQYAALGDWATVSLLLDAGLKVNDREPRRQVTALHNAAAQGHARLAQRLLDLGADVKAQDWHGVTPLIAAVAGGHTKLVTMLLAKGSDVNVVPAAAPTALLCAVQRGDLPMVELLLKAGAKADLADVFGQSPLAAARLSAQAGLEARIQAALAGGGGA